MRHLRLWRGGIYLILGCAAAAQSTGPDDGGGAPAVTFRTQGPSRSPGERIPTGIAFRTDSPTPPDEETASAISLRGQPPIPENIETQSSVPFRGQAPIINTESNVIPPGANAGTVGESQQEMEDLSDQKQTIESEIRYTRAKLEEVRKRLDVESMAGHAEEADKWQQELSDWQDRLKSLESQRTAIDNEVQGAIQQLQPPPAPENTLILPGDNLEIFVNEDTSFDGRYQVRRGGYVILPPVGRIAVAGKTLSDAETEVRKALEATQLQHATVMVEKVEGSDIETGPVIYLAGEFKNPHPYKIPIGTKATVISVILSCEVTDQADLSRVKVMRVVANKSVVEEENVQRILDGNGLTSDLTLNDGDVLMVPAGSSNVIFITGKVARPGSLPLKPGLKLSAYAAILDSGGFGRFADLKKVYVLRASPDGTKVRIPVNIDAIQHGRAADLPLEGSDIIIVPEKFFSF